MGPLDNIPGVGDYFHLSLSLSNDSLTVMYPDSTVRLARFHPKDAVDWLGGEDIPSTATGVGLDGTNCPRTGTISVDFVELDTLPYGGERARDKGSHRLVVE